MDFLHKLDSLFEAPFFGDLPPRLSTGSVRPMAHQSALSALEAAAQAVDAGLLHQSAAPDQMDAHLRQRAAVAVAAHCAQRTALTSSVELAAALLQASVSLLRQRLAGEGSGGMLQLHCSMSVPGHK